MEFFCKELQFLLKTYHCCNFHSCKSSYRYSKAPKLIATTYRISSAMLYILKKKSSFVSVYRLTFLSVKRNYEVKSIARVSKRNKREPKKKKIKTRSSCMKKRATQSGSEVSREREREGVNFSTRAQKFVFAPLRPLCSKALSSLFFLSLSCASLMNETPSNARARKA